jgi:trans-2,3-dihydro-3-hydroxyanthranilate isomerase
MRYLHYDVFTDQPFEGNQLAVVPRPDAAMSTAAMQRIANEMAFSETTFVFPREKSGDVKMRIFTPGSELPMAGHPTIGTTFALAREGVIASGRETFVFECGVGPIPVALEWSGNDLAFAWMTQPLPTFDGEIGDRRGFAAAAGLEPGDLVDVPIQIVSCGVPYAYVALQSRLAVDRVSIDRRALARIYRASGVDEHATFFFTMDRTGASGDETVYSRMLAPAFGIAEDPATGSASGPLGCYMLYHGMVDADRAQSLISLQGVAMQRPSRLYISIDSNDGSIAKVRVGGKAVLVAEGTLLARPGS